MRAPSKSASTGSASACRRLIRTAKPSRSRSARCQTCSRGQNAPPGPGASRSSLLKDPNDASRKVSMDPRVCRASWRSKGVSFMYSIISIDLPHRCEVPPKHLEALDPSEQGDEMCRVHDEDIARATAG